VLILSEKPSISAYARLLYKNNLLGKQDLKDVEQLAGMRNDAAHGDFDALSRERAGLRSSKSNYSSDAFRQSLVVEPGPILSGSSVRHFFVGYMDRTGSAGSQPRCCRP
jgi:hypothetical protein